MRTPRDWKGGTLVRQLAKLDFEVVGTVGSHVRMRHQPTGGRLTVVLHNPIAPTTLDSILRSVAEITGLTREDLIERLS